MYEYKNGVDKNMSARLIFFDIDGTLVAELSKPSVLTREGIKRTRAKGNKVFLSTGRNTAIIGDDILAIGFDGMVASAGGYVEAEGRVLFDNLLSEELIQECLSVFHAQGVYCRIESPEGIYTDPQMEQLLKTAKPDKANSELIRMQKEIEAGIDIRPYMEYPRNGAYKICFTATSLKAVEATKYFLGDRFEYVVHPYGDATSCFNGEIIRKGIDKGKGMERICQYYGADRKDTIAFGDSMNDYAMLVSAGVSIAMGNACEELKRIADIVCEGVKEDGVYYQLERMNLL